MVMMNKVEFTANYEVYLKEMVKSNQIDYTTKDEEGKTESRTFKVYTLVGLLLTREFGEDPEGVDQEKVKFYKSDDGIYSFDLPEAHVAIVPNPSEVLPTREENQSETMLTSSQNPPTDNFLPSHHLALITQPVLGARSRKKGNQILLQTPMQEKFDATNHQRRNSSNHSPSLILPTNRVNSHKKNIVFLK